MLRAARLAKRQRLWDQSLSALQAKTHVPLASLEPEQRGVLLAALQVLSVLQSTPVLHRVVGFFLLHCGLRLPAAVVGAAVGLRPRAVYALKHTPAGALLASLRRSPSGTKPKLCAQHVGPIARFLVDHPDATLPQVHLFARSQLGVSVKRHALRRFFLRYGLGVLKQHGVESAPLFVGHTRFAGAFVLLRVAVRLDTLARRWLAAGELTATAASRLVLSLFFKAVLGVQRIFHFSTLQDVGLAILTGGRRVVGRTRLGYWVRHAASAAVQQLLRKSEPRLPRGSRHLISLDEHAVPRFTRKFHLPKGFHSVRNKFMPVEMLYFSFHCSLRWLLGLRVTNGEGRLARVGAQLLAKLRPKLRGAQLRVLVDAGAAKNTNELLTLVDHPNQVTLARTPRRPSYLKAWKKLPAPLWQRREEAGPCVGAPPKVIHLTQTTTQLTDTRGETAIPRQVRTIVIRETARSGKDRWHALWIFGDDTTDAYVLVEEFRQRQQHEQRYRIMLHDALVDAAPSGYDKRSPNPKRPRFRPAALTLYAWTVGLATDALERLSHRLGPRWVHCHPRTLRRYLLGLPGELYLLGSDRLLVVIHAQRLRSLWEPLVRRLNRDPVRIPWLQNRKLLLCLDRPPGYRNRQSFTIP